MKSISILLAEITQYKGTLNDSTLSSDKKLEGINPLLEDVIELLNGLKASEKFQPLLAIFLEVFKGYSTCSINSMIHDIAYILLILSESNDAIAIREVSMRMTKKLGKTPGSISGSFNYLLEANLVELVEFLESPKKRYKLTDHGRDILSKLTFK